MKKIYPILSALLLAAACQQEVVYKIDYQIALDKENTYLAGEPVKFNFTGSVDNIVFYSGETGHKYEFRDRYQVDPNMVNDASLKIDYQARYGLADALDVWVSKDFQGLSGNDAKADKETVKAMVDGGMQGWQRLDYQEGASQKWTHQDYTINDYMDNFCVAFHWHPAKTTEIQRTYWIKGGISLELEGMKPSTINFGSMDFVTLMMNDEYETYADPYVRNSITYPKGIGEKDKGIMILNKPATADFIFQGIGKNKLPFTIDGWAISKPMPLNKVENDKGVVIKNLQNYLHTYEYIWEEPGTYTVTFFGTNSNYAGASQEIKTFTITILDNSDWGK